MIWNKAFWKDTLERCLYTMVECLLASVSARLLLNQVDWKLVILTTLSAGAITFLKQLLVGLNYK